jgi:hypothetical protein
MEGGRLAIDISAALFLLLDIYLINTLTSLQVAETLWFELTSLS